MKPQFYPPPLPHLASTGTTETSRRIRSAYVTLAWSSAGPLTFVRYVAACLTWPLVLAVEAVLTTARNGADVAQRGGKSRLRQVFEQIRLGLSHSIRPRNYYIFELYDPAHAGSAGRYLQRFETKGRLFSALRKSNLPEDQRKCLGNKVRFFERCRAMKIATPPVLMALGDGGLLSLEYGWCSLPPIDLFLKPAHANGGDGAELWRHADESWSHGGEKLGCDAFLERALERSQRGPIVIQPALRAHPVIANLSLGALPTVRIVTVVDEFGDIEVAGAALRMSVKGDSAVDNFHAGGIAAAVDLQSGRLGQATSIGLGRRCAWHDRHPGTGAAIAGTRLPHWPAALDLVRKAHALLNDRAVIGWDVAILQDGPILIEGNGMPDFDIHQRVQRAPLGDSRLARLLVFHAQRYIDRRSPARLAGHRPATFPDP